MKIKHSVVHHGEKQPVSDRVLTPILFYFFYFTLYRPRSKKQNSKSSETSSNCSTPPAKRARISEEQHRYEMKTVQLKTTTFKVGSFSQKAIDPSRFNTRVVIDSKFKANLSRTHTQQFTKLSSSHSNNRYGIYYTI